MKCSTSVFVWTQRDGPPGDKLQKCSLSLGWPALWIVKWGVGLCSVYKLHNCTEWSCPYPVSRCVNLTQTPESLILLQKFCVVAGKSHITIGFPPLWLFPIILSLPGSSKSKRNPVLAWCGMLQSKPFVGYFTKGRAISPCLPIQHIKVFFLPNTMLSLRWIPHMHNTFSPFLLFEFRILHRYKHLWEMLHEKPLSSIDIMTVYAFIRCFPWDGATWD